MSRVDPPPQQSAVDAASSDVFPSPRAGWRAVFALLALYGLAMLDRQVLSLMVGMIRTDLDVTDFQVGLLQGLSFALMFCLCGLPLGYAVDRFPRRWIILIGVLVWALATTASGFAATYGQLFVARMFVGIGEAALGPAAFSILSDLFPPRKLTFALSIYSIGSLIGNAIAFGLSGWVIQHAATNAALLEGFRPWQAVFVLVGAPGLLLAFVVFLFPEPERRGQGRQQGSWGDLGRFMAKRWRFFVGHLGGFSCMMTIAYANLGWVPTFLVRRFGWTIAEVGATLAVYQLLVGICCFLTSGRIIDWLWRRGHSDAHLRFYAFGTIAVTICGSLAFRSTVPGVYFTLIAVTALWTNLAAIAPAALQIVTPNELRGRVSAIYLLVTGLIGMTAGPAIVSALTDFAFHDDQKLHLSLSTTMMVIGPLAGLFFWFGMRPMRDAQALVGK